MGFNDQAFTSDGPNLTATLILGRLNYLGVTVIAEGGDLKWQPKHGPSPDLVDNMKRHKPALLALLTAQEPEVDEGMPAARLLRLIDGPWRNWPAGWESWLVTRYVYRLAVEHYLAGLSDEPPPGEGRGIVLVGGDLGGVVCYDLALRYPGSVPRMALTIFAATSGRRKASAGPSPARMRCAA